MIVCETVGPGSNPGVRTKVYVKYVIIENYYSMTHKRIIKFYRNRDKALTNNNIFSRYYDRISLDELNKIYDFGSRK